MIGRDPDGHAGGFLHFAVSRAARRCRCRRCRGCATTPNGFNEWLVCEPSSGRAITASTRVSLNFAPFAALLAPEAELSGLQEVERRALLRLKGHFQLDNLLALQPQVLPALGAAVRGLRAAAGSAAGRDRGTGR